MRRWLISELRLFLVAVQFLTRLPVPSQPSFEPAWLDRSAKYFPLVGLVVGSLCALVALAAASIWATPIPAVLAVGAGILITGAFHEDGLADTADGLGGGLTRERRLEIMKDSRIGTYGASALITVLLLRIACVASLPVEQAVAALVAAHCSARLAPLLMIRLARYAGDPAASRLKPLATRLGGLELAFACLVAAAVTIVALGPVSALASLLLAVVLAGAVARLAVRLIGGYTGDVLGAMEQMAEVAVLMAAAGGLGAVS